MPLKCEKCGKCHTRKTGCYTEATYKQFRKLVLMSESLKQMDRIESRLRFPSFIEEHSKVVCEMMFERLNREEPTHD